MVPDDGGLREPGDLGVGDPLGVLEPAGQAPEPAAQDDGDLGNGAHPLADGPRGRLDSRGRLGAGDGHRRMPAIVAERKLASVPAIMARKPSRARSRFRSGASAPMPPS